MHTKTELLGLLRSRGLRLTKRLGQHYVIDARLAAHLVDLCDLATDDTVIEIGAGLGAFTDLLASRVNRVVAVEVDRAVCELLKARLVSRPNVDIVCQDILAFDWTRIPRCKVVGAIPYQITSPILVDLCEHASQVTGAWLGLQQEVASRLTARPGTKDYGRLTILVQYRFQVSQRARIPRAAFFPQPRVDSAWLQLTTRPSPAVSVANESLFFEVVRAAFSQRRKTPLNCLGQLPTPRLSRSEALEALRRTGIPAGARGETLSLETFASLTKVLDEL